MVLNQEEDNMDAMVQAANLDKAMNYVRMDGPLNAPVCFLTIEDGGSLPCNTAEEFMSKSFPPEGEAWKGTDGKPIDINPVDKPAQFMSKLMMTIFGNNMDGWQNYRDHLLCLRNELNIRFYPIARHGTAEWQAQVRDAIGLSNRKYAAHCQEMRPTIIHTKCRTAFEGKRLHIILGARSEWIDFLKRFVYSGELTCEPCHDSEQKMKYAIYRQSDKRLAFAYFDVFRRGITITDIPEFADILRPLVDLEISKQVDIRG